MTLDERLEALFEALPDEDAHRDLITEAFREAVEAERSRCAGIADERAKISEDAANKTDDPVEKRSEMCASLEASHIAAKIRERARREKDSG